VVKKDLYEKEKYGNVLKRQIALGDGLQGCV
jgi:hypothetical protein